MEPRGSGHYGVMLIGEALGADEAESGKPFVGRAGKQLQECIDWAGLELDGFTIANTVWCRPPDNKLEGEEYERGAVDHCYRQHLGPLIDKVNPKVLMPLGKVATRALIGMDAILKVRGYVYRGPGGRLVLPSVHPSFIQRGQTKWIQVLVHDLQRAVELAKEGWHPCTPTYHLDPTPDQAMAIVEGMIASGNPIAYDIETPNKGEEEDENDTGDAKPQPIIRIGFSAGEYTGLSIPFSRKFHPVIRRALASPVDKIVWNGAFDNPRLYAHGFDIQGVIHDGMVAWHILHSDLPKGLGFVATMVCPEQPPWKHLGRDLPAYYNAVDADVEFRATKRIFDLLQKTGLWGVYERHVLKIDKVFARMSRAGMPIDHTVRLEKARQLTSMLETINAEVQKVVPLEVHPHHPKKGYKKLKPEDPDDSGWVLLPTLLWAKRLPFVPSSGPHGGLVRYQDFLGHTPVRVDGKRTTDEAAVHRLMLRYPEDKLYPLLQQRQEVVKLGGTYVGWIDEKGLLGGGLRVGGDSRIHCTFTHNPSTLRTSCVAPNLQQIPRATGLGAVVKAFFVAPPGYLLGEIDYAAIEALLVGYFANSDRYMRLARLGVHDFVNAFALHELDGVLTAADLPDLAWSDADLTAYFSALKKRFPEERQVRKRMVHARNYMVGWKETQQVLLKEQGKVVVAADIKKFLRFYDDLVPEIGIWQRELYLTVGGVDGATYTGRGEAGSGWVRNPYGYLHRYNRAVEWERVGGKWQAHAGVDAKRLVAFLPQSTAAAIIKEAMLRARDDEEIMDCLRLLVHDSLVLEMPEARAHDILARMASIMQQPNAELGGLRVGTETKVGRTWLFTE